MNKFRIALFLGVIGVLSIMVACDKDDMDGNNGIVKVSDDVYFDGQLYYNIKNSNDSIHEAFLERCEKDVVSITIPSQITIDGIAYTCLAIGNRAFTDCNLLTSVTIPNSVKYIGASAFAYCSNLTSIIIPESIIRIGNNAFECCYSLTSVNIPESVGVINEETFMGCSNLTSITIPPKVQRISNRAFSGCRKLTSVTIPMRDVTYFYVGDEAFMGCSSLTSISLPENVSSSIGYRAFASCSNLTSMTIPVCVMAIGDNAFQFCYSLVSVYFIKRDIHGLYSPIEIGRNTFMDCTRLTYIDMTNAVSSIGEGAFESCRSLTSITIPVSVRHIGKDAFNRCNFTSIVCKSSTPPDYAGNSDSDILHSPYSATLYVPKGSLDAYQNSDWNLFKNIVEEE